MCILFISTSHPRYSFICASNRDEFLHRSTQALGWHRGGKGGGAGGAQHASASLESARKADDLLITRTDENQASAGESHSAAGQQDEVLSGLDLSAGGTWLGLTRGGRIAALTNYTESAPPSLPSHCGLDKHLSRGNLTKAWLDASWCEGASAEQGGDREDDGKRYLEQHVVPNRDLYAGFNLIVGHLRSEKAEDHAAELWYTSNRIEEKHALPVRFVAAGQMAEQVRTQQAQAQTSAGLSNSTLQEPWEKVSVGRRKFEQVIAHHAANGGADADPAAEDALIEELFSLLGTSLPDSEPLTRENFKRSIHIPPVRLPDKTQSAPMDPNKTAWYATRVATTILVERRDAAARVRVIERDVWTLDQQARPARADKKGQREERWVL
ncbi:hypothetical protein IE81DRAFT_346177 [Ceraceosorus guamensis]|uniref:DUF833-domain-containing protein n=1 Tax=Ceraceosorus guamensis TaxID=1522189 RepID=A0A316W6T0_9BASI|nr:hypothetical protein IE81DRAFT_346177 [Ceraceosorus guamensis]PWN43783.1 hypothetical protein IE81DRAFT_346177 [Ceraceosorus guamensis]